MKKLLSIVLLTLTPFGCSVIEDVGRYASDNPIVVDAATRQAVFRYIDKGTTEQDKSDRARQVIDVVRDVDAFLDGNPTSSVDALFTVVESHVQWERLSMADRFLVQDILSLVRLNLENKQNEGLLAADAIIGIRALLETAASTAALL